MSAKIWALKIRLIFVRKIYGFSQAFTMSEKRYILIKELDTLPLRSLPHR